MNYYEHELNELQELQKNVTNVIKKYFFKIFFLKFILILPNPPVITSSVTRNYAGNYADFALQVIFEH